MRISGIIVLVLFMTAGFVMVSPPSAQAAPTDESCFTFDSGTGTITDYTVNPPLCPLDVEIPSQIGGVDVEHIGQLSFDFLGLTSVSFPNTLQSIGQHAFSTNELTSVVIPDGVTVIENNTFYDNNLITVVLPNGLTSIDDRAFTGNNITSISLPSTLQFIGEQVFYQNNLSSVTIPNSVTQMEYRAFAENQLTSVVLSNGVANIPDNAFSQNLIESLTIPEGVTEVSQFAFVGNRISTLSLPSTLTTIGSTAFGMNLIEGVNLPASLVSIGSTAFAQNRIKAVMIPNSVISIGGMAFFGQSEIGGAINDEIMSGDPERIQNAMNLIWYTQLYTETISNPNGFTDEVITEISAGGDLNGDGDSTDSLGGHLVNPAYIVVQHHDNGGGEVTSDTLIVGDGLDSYLAHLNPTNDTNLYFRVGDNYEITPPDITGYTKPEPYEMALVLGANTHTFVYTAVGSSGDGGEQGDSGSSAGGSGDKALAETGLFALKNIIIGLMLISTTVYLFFKNKRLIYRLHSR